MEDVLIVEDSQQDQEDPSFKDVVRHGTKKTICLQLVATFAAFASGAALPGLMLLWGDMGNDFLKYAMFDPEYSANAFQRDINKTALIIVYLFLGKVVASYAYMVLYTMAAAEIACNMRASHVQLTLKQSVASVDAINDGLVGGITQSLQNIAKVEIGLGEQLGTAMQLISILVSALIISLIRQWKLALVVYTVIPLTLFTVAGTVVFDVKYDIELRKRLEAASSLAKDALANVRDVFACTAEPYFTSQYNTVLEESMRFGFKKAPVIGLQYASELFFVSIGYTLSFWYGTLLYSQGVASIGSVLTIFFNIALANSSLSGISVQVLALSSAFGAAQGLTKFTKMHEELVAPKSTSTISTTESLLTEKRVTGYIEFRNVSFSYPSRPDVLICDNLSFDFPAGKTTAVVGASGSGKSTVVALIERWFEIDSGQICLDGVDIRRLNPQWFRKQIGLVNQEPTLFQGTIYQNVARGLIGTPYEHTSDAEKMQRISDACDIADATEFVSRLPEGYNTWIGQSGGTLSGGQKQRIAIARAIVSNPRILILDEPTAALDALTERTVLSALERASVGRTCICVTHKPQQASTADYVLMVTPAGVAERGSPKNLIEKGGLFHTFMASSGSSSDVTQEKGDYQNTSNVVTVAKNRDSWMDMNLSDVEEQRNRAAQAADYSLLRCIAIIMWGHRQYWPWMLAMFIPCILGGMIFPVEAVLFGEMVKVFEEPVPAVHHSMQPWVYGFLGLSFVTLAIYGMIGYFGTVLNYKLGREHRLQYFRTIITQNIAFFDEKNNSPGILATKLVKHPDEIEDMLGRNIPVIIIILVTSICCTILAIAIGWKFGLVSVFGCLAPVCVAGYIRIQLEYIIEKRTGQLYYDSAGFAADSVGAMRTVIALCLQDVLSSEYREMLERPMKIARKMAFVTYLFLALVDSLSICGFALCFWYGGTLLARREYGLKSFYVIFAAIIFGTQSIARLFSFTYSFTKGKFAANHVLGWSTTPELQASLSRQIAPYLHDNEIAVAFRNVRFGYSTRAKLVLRDISFEVRRGQKVAFVGRSGSGKSTIFSLLERFYEHTDGDIRLLDRSLDEYDVNTTRNQIAIVSQHPFLYKGTIKENLVLGLSRAASEEDIVEACQQAAIWDFISSLPAGLETPCGGNGGISFSGGQRQRIVIARALLRKPQILLLDEATSSLDVENEKIIVNAMEQLPPHVTVIANAHRLTSIRNFDMIFVMEDGRIVERGDYADLMRRKGRFFDLAQSQGSF